MGKKVYHPTSGVTTLNAGAFAVSFRVVLGLFCWGSSGSQCFLHPNVESGLPAKSCQLCKQIIIIF